MAGIGFKAAAACRLCTALLVVGGALSAAPALAAPQLRLTMQPPPTLDTHTRGEKFVAFGVTLLNGETATAPLTLRLELPPHVSLHAAPQNPQLWSCNGSGQTVTCTYAQTLTAANGLSFSLGIELDVDGDLPVPGSSDLRATLENAQLPLPDPLVCADTTPGSNVATSETGCVQRSVAHRDSQVVVLPATWQHSLAQFEAGASTQQFSVGFSNAGFTGAHTPVTARFLLPPGLTYRSVFGQVVWTCSAAPPDAQGQLVTCTTPYFFDGMGPQQANIGLRVDVAPDVAVPGPLPIFATISNPDQPPPDFAACDDPDPPVGCGHYTIPTRAARVSRMDITAMTASPAVFPVGQQGLVSVAYTNLGDGNATAATLSFALPPGFAYASHTASPSMVCAVVAGTAATGQTLDCRYGAAYPPGVAGTLNLRLNVQSGAAGASLLVGSASDDGRPGPSLAQCIADPAQPEPMIGCGRRLLQVAPWLFCDGFERLPHVCGQPQSFP